MNNSSICNRRSIRKFQDTSVSNEQIEIIIQAGITAPSAKNRQPFKCVVLGNRYKEEFLAEMEKGIDKEEHSRALPIPVLRIRSWFLILMCRGS